MRAARDQHRVEADSSVEPDSTPTPPPFAVRIEAPAELAPRGRSWEKAAWFGAILALPLAVWVGRGVAPTAEAPGSTAEVNAVAAEPAPTDDGRGSAAAMPAAARSGADAPAVRPRADAKLNRDERHHPLRGGVLFTPKTFASEDGAYDLYVHFHGNTKVVLESAEVAGVNAFVAIVNLGVGSAPYEHDYIQPGSYAKLLAEVQHGVEERGLEGAHVRRIALGSWSAGYGAIGGILQQPKSHEHLDALLVLDGIHVGWIEDDRTRLNALNLFPFVDAAKAAGRGDFLFSITHSEVVPEDYASTTATADLLLDAVSGARHAVDDRDAPPHLALESAKNAVSKKLEKHMEPLSEATVGAFHVRGYRGNTPEHHMAHLLQMGATVMPELAARWERLPSAP
jgi:hypothetical protein